MVPPSLMRLIEHNERTRWLAAILLRTPSRRWPNWSCQFAVATVDSALGVHESDFLVRPPAGWEENGRVDLPQGITPERLIKEALSPSQAMIALNEIFGEMEVHGSGTTRPYGMHRHFEDGAGISASWTLASSWSILGDDLEITLDRNSYVRFGSILPQRGDLVSRAREWAHGYVDTQIAHRLLMRSLDEYDGVK